MSQIHYIPLIMLLISMIPVGNASMSPDLSLEQISAPLTSSPGFPYLINTTLMNMGNTSSGVSTVGYYLSSDRNLSEEDPLLWAEYADILKSGERKTISSKNTFPEKIPAGSYYLIALVQDDGGNDRNLNNNGGYLTEPVQVIIKPLPDQEEFNAQVSWNIFNMTNNERTLRGIPPVVWDQKLADLGRGHTDSMATKHYFNHTDPEGRTAKERAEDAGYPVIKMIEGGERVGIAENLAYVSSGQVLNYGYVDPTDPDSVAREIMDGWMKSLGHRNNILDPLADRLGVSITYNVQYFYVAQEYY